MVAMPRCVSAAWKWRRSKRCIVRIRSRLNSTNYSVEEIATKNFDTGLNRRMYQQPV
ncbi:hypothetical protein KCP70_23125 [Salmonella enterica subsp. enterica]|nr:hypothetical protein KCP70_23125 [Salmonella enterica subsp. enterica]